METEHHHRNNPWLYCTIHTAVAQDLKRAPELHALGLFSYLSSNHKLDWYIACTPSIASAVSSTNAMKRITMDPISSAFMTVPGLSLSCL